MSKNKEVKKLFYDLWDKFPDGVFIEKDINKVIMASDVRKSLVKQGFLAKTPYRWGKKDGFWYFLGGNGIALITAWETQKLTKWAVMMAFISLGLSILALSISLMK